MSVCHWLIVVLVVMVVILLACVFMSSTRQSACNGSAQRINGPYKVSLLLIATGRYKTFLSRVISDARQHFLRKHDVEIVVFTDDVDAAPAGTRAVHVTRKGFPGDSMYRFHYFLSDEANLRQRDYLFYVDVDPYIMRDVDEKALLVPEGLVATRHLHEIGGEWGKGLKGSPETDPKSTAAIPEDAVMHGYYAGGFQGGRSDAYLAAAREIATAIDTDTDNNVVAKWHDESHWNKYLHNNPPAATVGQAYVFPEYCLPGSKGKCIFAKLKGVSPVVVARDKDHATIRSE